MRKLKVCLYSFIALLFIGIAFGVTTPNSDFDLRYVYNIRNVSNMTAVNVSATYLSGDGSAITGITADVASNATEWAGMTSINNTWLQNTSGILAVNESYPDARYLSAVHYGYLSNFTDDLGNRGYTHLSNFTDDVIIGNYIDWASENYLNVTNASYWGGYGDVVLQQPTTIYVQDNEASAFAVTEDGIEYILVNTTDGYERISWGRIGGNIGLSYMINGLYNFTSQYIYGESSIYGFNEINATAFYQNGNAVLDSSQESNLNVNKSGFWDDLDSPSDITSLGTLVSLTSSGVVNASEFYGNLNYTYLQNYPSACPSNTYISQLDDTATCSAVSQFDNALDLNTNSIENITHISAADAIITNANITNILGYYGSACSANEFVTDIADNGDLTCAAASVAGDSIWANDSVWANTTLSVWFIASVNISGTLNISSTADFGGNLDMNNNDIDAIGSLTNYYGSACAADSFISDVADNGDFTCSEKSDTWINSTGDAVTGNFNITGYVNVSSDLQTSTNLTVLDKICLNLGCSAYMYANSTGAVIIHGD